MNTFGRIFRVSVFGESHGPVVGVTVDGVPAGLSLSEQDFSEDIARRAAGTRGTTVRREPDRPEIISGVSEGHTTGAPVTVIFRNTDTESGCYGKFRETPRPGHADYAASVKWNGFNDIRGGGQFSGRMTLPVVAAGTIAGKLLDGMEIKAVLTEAGGCTDEDGIGRAIESAGAAGDTLGGVIECNVSNVPAGLGEPFWDSVESMISHAVFSIPGIRGIAFGDGFGAAAMKGSEHNDPFGPEGPVKNGSGGVNGGITNGAGIRFRVAVKPASSIRKSQTTWNFRTGENDTLTVEGRHDTCFALRTPVIVEAMTAIVLADLKLISF